MSKPKHSDKLIEQTNKLLSQHYGFTFVGSEFYAIEFDDETKRLTRSLFVAHAKMLIGEDAEELIINWFDRKKNEVVSKLLEYLDSLDKSQRGSIKMSYEMLLHFENDPLISDEAVIAFFESHYINNVLPNILEEEFASLDPNSVEVKQFVDLKQNFKKTETDKICQLINEKLNDWYADSVLGDKIKELFSQFVITLGKTDWKVTWIGQGLVTDEKILKYFRLDTDAYDEFIINKYQEWYSDAVIEASEREMNNAHNFELYNKIKSGELKMNSKELDDL